MSFNFYNKEIVRYSTPFSVNLLSKVLRSWCYGNKPWSQLLLNQMLETLKEKISSDSSYLQRLIKKYFLENKNRSFVTVEPSIKLYEKALLEEKKRAQALYTLKGENTVLHEEKILSAYQNLIDDESCIKKISRKDLPKELVPSTLKRLDSYEIPVFYSKNSTNGILYCQIMFPCDTVNPKDYPLISILASFATQIGLKNKEWDIALQEVQQVSGDFRSSVMCLNIPDCVKSDIEKESNIKGRDYFVFEFKVLSENIKAAFEIISNYILTIDFSDEKRLLELLKISSSEFISLLNQNPGYIANLRSRCTVTREGAVKELLYGLKNYEVLNNLLSTDIKKAAQKLNKLLKSILSNGAILQLNCDTETYSAAKKYVPHFISDLRLHTTAGKNNTSINDFLPYLRLKQSKNNKFLAFQNKDVEVISIEGSVSYASCTNYMAPYGTKESEAQIVVMHLLENSILWEEIRNKGGAYGVWLNSVSALGYSTFMTYRDPTPFNSIEKYLSIKNSLSENEFDDDDIEKSIMSLYSRVIEPESPYKKGNKDMMFYLSGRTDSIIKMNIRNLLSLNKKDIQLALKDFSSKEVCGKIVICSPASNFTKKEKKLVKNFII